MSSPNAEQALTLKAAEVARSAPNSWAQFMDALTKFTNDQIMNCVQSPLDQLPVTQGRAQFAARLHGILADCITNADRIERKK